MSNPEIQAINAEVDAIRDMLNNELDGIESTVICHGEAIAMVSGLSQENQNVIRSLVRRFEKAIRRLEERIAKLEEKGDRDVR